MYKTTRTRPTMSRRSSAANFLALSVLWWASPAYAQSMPSIGTMFANFSETSTVLMDLVVGVAFVVGIFVSILSLLKFKEYAESGGRVKLHTPIALMIIGACMVALPGMINTATETLALGANTGKSLLSTPTGGGGATAAMGAAIAGVLLFIKLIGHIAFFRGFLLLKQLSEGNQNATIGRALTHIAGGAFAININATASFLAATFAPGLPLPF
jgi:hypothetical protein